MGMSIRLHIFLVMLCNGPLTLGIDVLTNGRVPCVNVTVHRSLPRLLFYCSYYCECAFNQLVFLAFLTGHTLSAHKTLWKN